MNDTAQALGLPVLSDDTFNNFRALIYEKTGIHMRDGKQILISNRLRRRLSALGLSSYEEYYHLLVSGRAQDELPNFIDAVSTNETYFFREANHFTALQAAVLPELFKRRKRVSDLERGLLHGRRAVHAADRHRRVLLEAAGAGEATIIGTDISTAVIRQAREGIYNERALEVRAAGSAAALFRPGRGRRPAGERCRCGAGGCSACTISSRIRLPGSPSTSSSAATS